VDAAIRAYFQLWQGEHKQRGAKARVYRELNEQFPHRTAKAFEYKFQNISAALSRLGCRWMPGVRPKPNIQGLLFNRVEAYLSANPSARRLTG
jgi:hypothetical protein